MITKNSLPYIQFNLVSSSIQEEKLFPFFAQFADEPFLICRNGSLLVFFRLDVLDYIFIDSVLEFLDESATLQVYKIKLLDDIQYFGCIKIRQDYSFLKLSMLDVLKRLFRGDDDLIERINMNTEDLIRRLSDLFTFHVEPIDLFHTHNNLYDNLIDYSLKNRKILLNEIPAVDMSVIKISNGKYFNILSLNNFDVEVSDILSDFEYVQIFSVCCSSKKYDNLLLNYYSDVFNSVKAMKMENCEFEDIKLYRSGQKYVFVHSSLMFWSSTVGGVGNVAKKARGKLFDNGLITYMHSNYAGINYISCFPGNAECGYHYNVYDKDVVGDLIRGYFEL